MFTRIYENSCNEKLHMGNTKVLTFSAMWLVLRQLFSIPNLLSGLTERYPATEKNSSDFMAWTYKKKDMLC